MKGWQIFAVHMEEEPKGKVPNIEDYAVQNEFENVFKEILGIPPKTNIDFYINLMLGETHVSKTPYRMIMLELKELKCILRRF